MTELRNYLESRRNLRFVLVGIVFLGASFALYMGVAAWFFLPDRKLIVPSGFLALILDLFAKPSGVKIEETK